jgi:hypothetical protein
MGFMDKLKGLAGGGGGGGMAGQASYAALAKRLGDAGVEAPGTIVSMGEPGPEQFGGGRWCDVEVSITPAGGTPYNATIHQSFLKAQLDAMSVGGAVKVKYDPADQTQALIYG